MDCSVSYTIRLWKIQNQEKHFLPFIHAQGNSSQEKTNPHSTETALDSPILFEITWDNHGENYDGFELFSCSTTRMIQTQKVLFFSVGDRIEFWYWIIAYCVFWDWIIPIPPLNGIAILCWLRGQHRHTPIVAVDTIWLNHEHLTFFEL